MEYTNNLDFPQYIVDWLQSDDYDHDDDPYTISATTLMKPTRAYLLNLRYQDRLCQDIVDLVASKMGNAIHDSIERVFTEGVLKETRARRELDMGSVTYTVTGKFDIMETQDGQCVLRDIKTTSTWSYIFGGKDEDYERQLSIYRWLNSADHDISDTAFIDFFFTDWQSTKARTESGYPKQRLVPGYKIQLMSLDETEAYIRERLTLIEADRNKADDQLTPCTRKELWAGDEKFAVYKNGGKKASRVLDTLQQAEEYQRAKNISGFIERRPPKVRRCNYCSAFPFCNQGASYQKQGLLA